MKRKWRFLSRRQVCLLILTPIVVWHILFYPLDDYKDSFLDNNNNVVDVTTTTITSSSSSSQWNSGPLRFSHNNRGEGENGESSSMIRGAAMMLVSKPWTNHRGLERKCYFNKSMDSLVQYWYPSNPYPIILQHPDGWTNQEMKEIRERWATTTTTTTTKLDIYFSKLGNAFHDDDDDDDKNNMLILEDWEKPLAPLGYKKMCAYKTYGFLQSPYVRTNDIDYMFYIDDDSCLTEPIKFDVFSKMKQNNIAYAYKQLFLDRDYVTKGLSDFVNEYVTKNRLRYANPTLREWLLLSTTEKQQQKGGSSSSSSSSNSNSNSHWTFSTNLEWIDLQQYRQSNIMDFLTIIRDSKMIYHRRWGDAPLRFLLSYLFWDNTQVMRICSIGYVHSMWEPSSSVTTCGDHNNNNNNIHKKNNNEHDAEEKDESTTVSIHDSVLNQLKECAPKTTCD